ncbi:TrmH family RNA methyltransferase [Alicyclobacillus tolerans]|uniref:TrmH family RNA methyltransferase n=1 Tax=Alicyclobacillus TaxID=29330 RepID=UPI001933139F|nr:RNA methyltransferase [Alicyclobacillus sp. TC]QRF22969.1 RNA methyltransferase [Alicyclobacillus sp. TC]
MTVQYIESPQNPKIRSLARLKKKNERWQKRRFLVEGEQLVRDLLESELCIETLVLLSTRQRDFSALESLSGYKKIEHVWEVSEQAYALVSDTESSQGILAVAVWPEEKTRPQYPEHVLLLDGLQDPGNVGTLIRSAEAFGVQEVCCGIGTVDFLSPKVVRAAMGGLFRLSVVGEALSVYIEEWKRCYPGGHVIAAQADAERMCHDVSLTAPTLLVIGSEAHGISASLLHLIDETLSIPMQKTVESLNAAMAGSVLLYEMYRQRLTQIL